MKRQISITLCIVALLAILLGTTTPQEILRVAKAAPLARPNLQGGAPTVVSYQGQVMVGGAVYSGSGYFKFALVNQAGTTTYWSNDGTSTSGSEPTNPVQLTVTDGLFNVLLGDTTLANMTALPATAFDGTARYLRVWFSSDGSGFTLLSPDRRIAAAPYALQAEESRNAWRLTGNAGTAPATDFLGTTDNQPLVVKTNGAEWLRLDTSGRLGLGAAPGTQRLTIRGTGAFSDWIQFQDASGVNQWHLNYSGGGLNFVESGVAENRLFLQDGGNVGIGTSDPQARLDVAGSIRTSSQLISTVGAGTAPLAVASTTHVDNLNADLLDSLDASAFWRLAGNSGANPASQFLGTTDAQPLVLRTNNVERARLDAAGNLGLGTNSPTERLTVQGNARVLGEDNPVAKGYTSTNLNYPISVFVAGRYAYVASQDNDRLAIFDVSDPANPVATGSTATNLDCPYSVFVAGRYAYVASKDNSRLAIFDVSNPANPVATGSTATNLDFPYSVFVAGHYAYVASWDNDRLAIFDVSDPANPVAAGWADTSLDRPTSVFVAGRYAYVASWGNDRLAIFDVSDPANPVAAGWADTYLDCPRSVFVAGRYAYVASMGNNRLVIFDVSDPANPVATGYTSTNLFSSTSVFVAGRYAYVTSYIGGRLAVFDVSDPANIVAQGYTNANLNGPYSVYVSGRTAYVASVGNSRLATFELNHLESPTLETGSLQSGALDVTDNAIVGNNLHVQGGLNVGPGGALIGGDVSVQGELFAHVSVATVTGNTTLAVPQSGVVLVNNAAAAIITLPTATSAKGLTFTIKRLTANAVTVGSGGGTIDGAATQSLVAQYDFITVVSDGANWFIVSR